MAQGGIAALMAGASLLIAGAAQAADTKPALIYDMGGKFDKSFNEGALHGAEAFKQSTGIAFRDFEIQNDAQREQAMRKFAKDGFNPVVAIGFSQASALEKVAGEFPGTQFTIVDAVVDKPNVSVGPVQGGRGLVPRRTARRHGVQDRQGRLRGRHGYPADPQVLLRLCSRREIRQPEGGGVCRT